MGLFDAHPAWRALRNSGAGTESVAHQQVDPSVLDLLDAVDLYNMRGRVEEGLLQAQAADLEVVFKAVR